MSPKTLLLTTAAAAALACGPVIAKPVHHHKAPAESAEVKALKEEVELLKAHVQSLEDRLETQSDAQKKTETDLASAQAAAASAQASAQAASAQVAANDTQIKTIPGVIEASVKKNTPKPGWWADTTVGGTVFADVSTISNKNAAGKTAQSGTNYDIKRAYLIVNHKFNNTYSFNFTTDFTFDNNTASPSGASKPTNNEAGGANTVAGIKATQLYIKKAYLQAHYADSFNIRLGAADMPWVPFVEGLNGYRFADQVLIDRTKFGTSADWGVHVYGDLFNKLVSYQV
jgi:Phosphate-selective porin O and P